MSLTMMTMSSRSQRSIPTDNMRVQIESARYIQAEGDVAVTARLSSGQSAERVVFIVPVRFYEQSGISVGELDEERFEALAAEAGVHGAFKRGLKILQNTSLSRRALAHRLTEKGVSKQDAELAVERLEFYRYLNERNNAMRIAQLSLKKGWGRMRILADLRQKGYDTTACRRVELCLDHVDFERYAVKVLQKRFGGLPEEERERQRAYRLLVNYGYSHTEIKRAFAALAEDDVDSLGRADLLSALNFEG